MGGPGSGRWYRWQGTRTTLEEVYRLDVRWLHRHGYLDGRPHWVTWSRGEQQAGSLLLALQPEGVVLTYRYRVGGGDWDISTEYRARVALHTAADMRSSLPERQYARYA